MKARRLFALTLCLGSAAWGCGVAPLVPADAPLRPSEALAGRGVASQSEALGARVYSEYCAGCHGEKGDGQGPAARFLDPKPRDFTRGLFKFAGVPSGQLPRDEDLMRTLVRGLPGSSMPSWALLSEGERRAVVAYIKTLSPAWSAQRPGAPVAVSEDPYGGRGAGEIRSAIERGRVVYHVVATCWQCHAAYASQEEVDRMVAAEKSDPVTLRPNAGRPDRVTDAWDRPLLATDFPSSRMKSGSAVEDIYLTIAAGIGGTAMPTWKDGLEEKDLWALSYYVKSLADRRWRRANAVPSRPAGAPAAAPKRTGD
ncbi:MAG: c-type cytochrome [Acidobacteriota bacterium]